MSDSNLGQLQICNSAILKVGGDMIASITDATKAAQICNAQYNVKRDELLLQVPWRFSLQQVKLTPQATQPIFQYTNAFLLPSDCLRPLKVNADPWTVQQGLILCNSDAINVTYIQIQNGNESSWDPLFAETFSLSLSKELALSLVQSVPLFQEIDKQYQQKLALARATNAVIGTPDRLIADMWSNARKGYDFFWPTAGGLPETYGPV